MLVVAEVEHAAEMGRDSVLDSAARGGVEGEPAESFVAADVAAVAGQRVYGGHFELQKALGCCVRWLWSVS